ncbi:helix-turn-helix domain-containing protein [Roseomonas terrae]|uniref:Helix-turn-helix domain-containing protein n=1 Tax=Neoroseomonas terrae TaxID=424799 RepID=A0ABS5EK40_9PROT|nr:YdaS family helix-turn-helix protein [Neoroseomonas terrae]MBR0651368.1 helix-turn-helix domain-containing protein [Neoroseomonas terrae]
MVTNPSASRNEQVAEACSADAMSVQDLMKALGGGVAVSEACAVSPQAVSNWIAEGRIPARHHPAVWRLAQAHGVNWRPPGYEGLRLVPMDGPHSVDGTVKVSPAAREKVVKSDHAA